ncbi:MAG: transglycosylase domain-containing protein [Pyrinomonadaceae bacterium]|nr:transglycosylase domain-containing protein [Pyrinomonadaceae bacterium]
MKRRRILIALLVLAVFPLAWAAVTGVRAYLRAPQLVAELDLPFAPSELSERRICALLAVQDPSFYRHQGIGLLDGHPGHTTLTQAVCKGLYFNGFSPGVLRQRKIKLMISAWAFDRQIPKDTQLRIFLNRGYFGDEDGKEILGFPAASTAFFGKDLRSVSELEYLSLLAMLDAPNSYNVVKYPEANAARVRSIETQVQSVCGP